MKQGNKPKFARENCFIPFCVSLATALALWAYFYTVTLPFRVVFLKHSIGPLLLWQISSPFSFTSIMLFTVFLIAIFFTAIYLQRKKRSLVPFASFWHLTLTPLILSPLSAKFPEFIPLALVLLPASSVAAFLVLIFWKKQGELNASSEKKFLCDEVKATSCGIFKPPLAPYMVWIITFFILLTSGLYVSERLQEGYFHGDARHYLNIATSMHKDHDIDLTNNIIGYKPPPRPPRHHISGYSSKGHSYSWHPVGLSLILAPFFDGVHDYREALIIMCIIGAFLASQMYLAVFEETGSTGISLFAWIVLSFSAPVWPYSYEAWPMMPCGLCMLYAWRRIRNFRENNIYQIAILNLVLAWLLWLHESFIVCYGILGLFLLYIWVRKGLASQPLHARTKRDPRAFITVILQGLNFGVFFWFHYRWFGKHLFGQEGRILTFWPGMLGIWFDHHWGIIFAAPIHLLCLILIFIYAFKKWNLSSLVLLTLYIAGFVIGTAGKHWTGGCSQPGRRLVGLIPLTCIPLGYFLNVRKTLTFYWLVGFLSLLSLGYMLFFIVVPGALDEPIRYLALSCQRFRTICFNLPSFGKTFDGFPWKHAGAVTLSFLSFTLLWVILLVKQGGKNSPQFMFTGMLVTLFWIFASTGWMQTHFDVSSPIPWNTTTNCAGKRNRCAIAHLPYERGLYRYLVYGLKKAKQKLSWSIEIKKRLPTYVDIAKGMYRFQITGTGKPLSTVTVTIFEMLEGRELYSFPVIIDSEQKFFYEFEMSLSHTVNRIKLELAPQDKEFTFKRLTLTPIPTGLESLISMIEEKGKESGWIRRVKDGIMDLSAVRKEIMTHIESLHVPGKPYGCYRFKKGGEPSLYATCDAAIIRTIMGEELKPSLRDKQRKEWINYINSFACEDGVYRPALRKHSNQHANGTVIGALGPLGGKQKYPVRLYNDFNRPDKIGSWLEKRDWKKFWSGSHLFWGGMHCYSFSSQCTEQWRRKTFEWLDANLDEQTGWWHKEVEHFRPGIDGLGGGAHIWPFYQHHNHPFPYPRRVIDSILAMQRENGNWREPFSNYLNLDALYGLAYMKSQVPGYREKDIATAVTKYGKLVMKEYPRFLPSNPNLHNILSVVSALGLLNQMVPETFRDSIKWTDIFSDIRLYQTKAVEVVK